MNWKDPYVKILYLITMIEFVSTIIYMYVFLYQYYTLSYILEKKVGKALRKYSYANVSQCKFIHTRILVVVGLYMLLCIPVIHDQARRRHHWRKLSTGDQLDKLNELLWPPPANLICIFTLSGTAGEYYVTICLCCFVGNKISICLTIPTVLHRELPGQNWNH